MAKSMIINKLS